MVLITIDTLRADHLSPYGYERATSPFLAEFAAESLLFENAISQCGTTPQSLSSLMTSRYPFTDRILTKNGGFAFLRRENRTLALRLAQAGYVTHAISSSVQAAPVTGLDLGFESFDGVEISAENRHGRNRRADEISDLARDWIAERPHPERPFFLWLHYLDPHHPYNAPESHLGRWSDEEPSREGRTRRYRYDPKNALDHPVSDGELARLVINYDREIRFADDCLRGLFESSLDELLEHSLVIFSADHGEALGDHGMIGHNDLFEPILHVPLLVRLPQADPPSGRVETPVMLVDVVPTVLDVIGLPMPSELRGRSLLPLFEHPSAFGERIRLAEYPGHQALYLDRFKLLHRAKGPRTGTRLFDVTADREERNDVSADHGALVEHLLLEAERLREETRAESSEDAGDEELPEVTPEMLEELKDLGYGS